MSKKRISLVLVIAAFGLVKTFAGNVLHFSVDLSERAQTIENIGSSTGMHGDYISKHWNTKTVDQIAELLFDREKGIGLSGFRIQIGGGATGPESGIREPYRRTDCFLQPDGTYDWNADRGVLYWRRKAAEYNVPAVIGYLNSPPVHYTENGYGFKTDKMFRSNLKAEHYGDYAEFLTRVAGHFQTLELPFDFICPVNEPQWAWFGVPGQAKQEGSPWTNEEIARLVRLTDARFRAAGVKTRLLIPEAAAYEALYAPQPDRAFAHATDQVRAFWDAESPDYVGNLHGVEHTVAGHAYFSDATIEKLITTRRAVRKSVTDTDPSLRFWQTEYSLLGRGWQGGLPADDVDEMTAALLVARNIHVDLTLANAAAWQWWSSTEPEVGRVPRYYLIECDASGKETFRATKVLWALGHYSRFVRPGMKRIRVESGEPLEESLGNVMAAAFLDERTGRWAMVLINFSDEERPFVVKPLHFPEIGKKQVVEGWITDAEHSMEPLTISGRRLALPPKSIITLNVLSDARTR